MTFVSICSSDIPGHPAHHHHNERSSSPIDENQSHVVDGIHSGTQQQSAPQSPVTLTRKQQQRQQYHQQRGFQVVGANGVFGAELTPPSSPPQKMNQQNWQRALHPSSSSSDLSSANGPRKSYAALRAPDCKRADSACYSGNQFDSPVFTRITSDKRQLVASPSPELRNSIPQPHRIGTLAATTNQDVNIFEQTLLGPGSRSPTNAAVPLKIAAHHSFGSSGKPPSPYLVTRVAPWLEGSHQSVYGSAPNPIHATHDTLSAREFASNPLHPLFLAKYSVQQELGFGATGFVVEATKLDDGRPVAVKFMFKDRIPVESWVRDRKLGMVPLEIFILKKVNHDHIVKFVDYFEDKKFFYLVMETHGMSWIDYKDEVAHAIEDQNMQPSYRLGPDMVPSDSWGSTDSLPVGNARTSRPSPFRLRRPSRRTSQDLFECIEQNPYMAESDVRHIFIQIADAIRHLHQNNIIHRDIKDENIVIDAHKNAKLIDFGNAAFIPRNEAAYLDRFYGTMHCAAPEVLRGERYRGPEQDVWALGVLLYTLAFSQTPFRDAHGIQEGKFSPPRFPRSPSMMDLLHHLLDPVSSTRYTIEDVLQHSWITAPALASVNDALFTPLPSSTITSSPPSVMVPSTTPHSITVIA